MNYNTLLRDFVRVLFVVIYPLGHLYGYFVLIGLYCLEQKKFAYWSPILVFFFYHLLAAAKVIYYMKLLINEGYSTMEIFPNLPEKKRKLHLEGINIFIQQDVISKNSDKIKKCNICNTYKPPRAHHCSVCNRCYLKLDHHCPFLDTCIGFHNYKFFYEFIFLNMCSSLFYIITLSLEIGAPNLQAVYVNYIVAVSLASLQLVFMCIYFIMHTVLISNNETVVEYKALNAYIQGDASYVHVFQEGPITSYSSSRERDVLNPYNISLKENWRQVFGNTWIDWIKPSITSPGDGTSFPKNYTEYDAI